MSSGYYSTGNGSIASDVSLDSVRKAIEDLKNITPNRRPPDAIFLSTRAFDELMQVRMFPPIIEFSDPKDPIRFKTQMLYGIPVFRFDTHSPLYTGVDWATGPDQHVDQVEWVEPVKPVSVPVWQWLVLAAVGAMILCLMGGAL